jgi:hypothetical protein
MKWVRSNTKGGSRLALFALVIQLVLSFGHFHADAARSAPAIQSGSALSDLSSANGLSAQDTAAKSSQPLPFGPESDQPSHDPCDICAVIAMANAVVSATPPLLLLPQAVTFLYVATDAGFVHPNSARAAFQPRAPPIS